MALAVGVAGALAWAVWQNEARDLVGMAHLAWWEGPPMVLLSVVTGTVLVRIGRAVGGWVRAAHRPIRRRLPAWAAVPATVLLGLAFVGLIGGQVVTRGFVAAGSVPGIASSAAFRYATSASLRSPAASNTAPAKYLRNARVE